MKAIAPFVVLIFGVLIQIMPFSVPRIGLPGQQKAVSQNTEDFSFFETNVSEGIQENVALGLNTGCADIRAKDLGFPFRINNYDECRNGTGTEQTGSWPALIVNSIGWVSLSAITFMLIKKKC